MEDKYSLEEQYTIQRKEIHRHYRKRKITKILIALAAFVICAAVFLLSLKKVFGDNNDLVCAISLVFGVCFFAVLIRLSFYQSHAEKRELEMLNQAAIAARLNDREG